MFTIPLFNLWKMRQVILYFAWMNIKIRFKGTYLGLLWTAVEPMLIFGFLYLIFTSIRITTREDFAIYFLTGMIIHHAFTRGTQVGLVSLKENFAIISSLNIRREFFPVVGTTTSAILLLVEIGVFFGLMLFFGYVPPWTIILFPVILGLLLVLILGMSYLLSIIFAYTKDVQPLWTIVTSILFFVTPIFWYLEDAGGIALEFQKINPLGQLVELGHSVVVYGIIPPLAEWLYTSSIIFGILILGYTLFQKFEKNILEKL